MFFGQTFELSDVPRVFFLTFLEILLSADNAIVLGLLASHLPNALKAKALYIGTVSAFVLRAISILLISYLIEYDWIQILGAAYLLYLSFHYFYKKRKSPTHAINRSFWKTVILIELFDLAFSIDSILAGIAFIGTSSMTTLGSKIWIVYVGGMMGLLGIRYAAHLFSSILHRFPGLETSAYLMIGWIGLKLAYHTLPYPPSFYFDFVFWTVLVLLFLIGLLRRKPV